MKLFIITGTCGAGKSTMKDELAFRLDPNRYACVDSDETGLNWWDYAGTEREGQYGADSLREAFRIAHGRNLPNGKGSMARTACGKRSGSPMVEIWSLLPVWRLMITSRKPPCRRN